MALTRATFGWGSNERESGSQASSQDRHGDRRGGDDPYSAEQVDETGGAIDHRARSRTGIAAADHRRDHARDHGGGGEHNAGGVDNGLTRVHEDSSSDSDHSTTCLLIDRPVDSDRDDDGRTNRAAQSPAFHEPNWI